MNKAILLVTAILMIASLSLNAQVAVTTDGSSADPSAMLDVKSSDKGFLPPRMTKQEKLDIVNPANGLVVYDTDLESLYLYNGTDWEPLAIGSGSKWEQGGSNIFRNTGNVGIGTNNPAALLHTSGVGTGQGNVLFTGEWKLSTPGPVPVSGPGTRMMWYPDKAAFRAGRVTFTEWNTENVGNFSFATGENTKASGGTSTAMGSFTIASGGGSTAMGQSTTASGDISTAMGQSTNASGNISTALGKSTTASGNFSTAMGQGTNASGPESTAMGDQTDATGESSTAMGSFTLASGFSSTAMGSSTIASGVFSTAMGLSTTAPSYVETTIGTFNTNYTPADATAFDVTDRLFVIGNGTSSVNRSDAMVVMKSGDVGIGTSTPDAKFEVKNSGDVSIRVNSSNNATAAIDLVRDGTTSTDWRIRNDANLEFFSSVDLDGGVVTEQYSFGTGIFRPSTDNTKQLGSNSNRWISVHAVNGTIQTSDAKMKKNVSSLNYGLDAVMQLKPVSYQWKDDNIDMSKEHIGFLAQDLQKVLPEVVVDFEWKEIPYSDQKELVTSENLGVNYAEITPVLVKAIQEQQQIIQELESQNAKLMETNKDILMRIEKLESQ